MQNVWLHFKACLNFAHTLVARIVSSYLPVFTSLLLSLLQGIFSPFIFVTSQQTMRVKGDLIVVTFLQQPQINMLNRLITPPDELSVEVFHVTHTHTHHIERFLSDCSVWSWQRECQPPPGDSRHVRRQQHSQGEDAVGGEGR